MNIGCFFLILIVIMGARQSPAQHDHQGEESSAVGFKENAGLTISEHTAEAMGLEMGEVTERPVEIDVEIVGQVYSIRGGDILASGQVAPGVATGIKAGYALRLHRADQEESVFTGQVVRVDTSLADASGLAEVIFKMSVNDSDVKMGDFVHAAPIHNGGAAHVVAVPAAALLKSAFGDFVYVQNGPALLRVPVTIGAANADWIEITDGLFAGDRVAVRPVEWLYLTELRATKGGGHCH